MKTRIVISLLWLAGSFLFLSSILYAANEYESRMMGVVAGQPGTRPTLDKANALETKLKDAKTINEVAAIQEKEGMELMRYYNAMSASLVFQQIIHRAWAFWIVSAFVPLLFLWSPTLMTWRRVQPRPEAGKQCIAA
jgi:hypothetical protein